MLLHNSRTRLNWNVFDALIHAPLSAFHSVAYPVWGIIIVGFGWGSVVPELEREQIEQENMDVCAILK